MPHSNMSRYKGPPIIDGLLYRDQAVWLSSLLYYGNGIKMSELEHRSRYLQSKKAFQKISGMSFHRKFGSDNWYYNFDLSLFFYENDE